MQVDAIYENGQVRIVTPVRLKKHVIRMRIDIPDEEIEQDPETGNMGKRGDKEQASGAFTDELKAILAPLREQLESTANQPLSKAEVREVLGDAWEEKHCD